MPSRRDKQQSGEHLPASQVNEKPRAKAGWKRFSASQELIKQEPSVCDPLWHESVQLNLSDSPVWAEW